jgi:hypothetical protein
MEKPMTLKDMEQLVLELNEAKPDQEKVRSLMTAVGLTYTENSIDQMSAVLTLMGQVQATSVRRQKKEKVAEL